MLSGGGSFCAQFGERAKRLPGGAEAAPHVVVVRCENAGLFAKTNIILIFMRLRNRCAILRTLSCFSVNYVGWECFAGGQCLGVVGFARLIYEVSKWAAKMQAQKQGAGR